MKKRKQSAMLVPLGSSDKGIDREKYWHSPANKGKHLADIVNLRFSNLKHNMSVIRTFWREYMAVYQNRLPEVSNSGFIGLMDNSYNRSGGQLTINVVASCIDTMTARITKNKTRCWFVTNGADDVTQNRARNCTRFVDGIFYDNLVYKQSIKVFRDAAICGTGFWRVEGKKKTKEIIIKHVAFDDIYVDELDGINGCPREITEKSQVSRLSLMNEYPDLADRISSIESRLEGYNPRNNVNEDIVQVIEIWRLETNKGTDDGRYVKIVGDMVLEDEPWKKNFPHIPYRWVEQPRGYWGTGITHEIFGIQLTINDHLQNIEDALYKFSMPVVWTPRGSNPSPEIKTTLIGRMVEFEGGEKPLIEPPRLVVSPQDYDMLWKLKEEAHDRVGLNQMTTSGQAYADWSGTAMMEARSQQSDRFVDKATAWDDMYLELGKRVLEEAKRIYPATYKVKLLDSATSTFDEIEFGEIDLEKDKFSINAISANSLPRSAEGRKQRVEIMAEGGIIDKEEILELLDSGDVEGATRLGDADWRFAISAVQKIMTTGEMVYPSKWHNIRLCLKSASRVYNDYTAQATYDQSVSMKLERYMEMLKRTLDADQPAPAPQAPAGPPVPEMMPPQGAM